MHANLHARAPGALLLSVAGCWSSAAMAGFEQLNMPVGVTPISQEVYDLHMIIFGICVVIGILVFGAMFYSIYHHRKSRGAVAAQFHESTRVEMLWTVIPFVILVAMAVPATKTLVAMEDTTDTELTVMITGYQWKWEYEFLDEDVRYFSSLATPREQIYNAANKDEHYLLEVDNPLVLPTDTKIRLLTTASDVIHSWWVPELGWKRDAIPGFVNDNWTLIEKPGIYRGQCTELCGKDHGFMPIVVDARSPDEFKQWLAEQQAAKTASGSTAATVDVDRAERLASLNAAQPKP